MTGRMSTAQAVWQNTDSAAWVMSMSVLGELTRVTGAIADVACGDGGMPVHRLTFGSGHHGRNSVLVPEGSLVVYTLGLSAPTLFVFSENRIIASASADTSVHVEAKTTVTSINIMPYMPYGFPPFV
jgi:hypothetical protein